MKRDDLEVAIAAGLCVAVPLFELFTMSESDGRPNPLTPAEAGALLLVLVSYAAPALLRRSPAARTVFRPVWLWVPLAGSALVVVAGYGFVFFHEGGLGLWAKVWLFLCVWTLPPAAAVHFSGAAVRRLKSWHEGRHEHLSILRR